MNLRLQTRIAPADRWDTQLLIVRQLYGGRVPRQRMVWINAFASTCAAIYIGIHFFRYQTGVISVFFAVMGILPTVEVLIQRNKVSTRDIDMLESAGKLHADTKLAWSLLVIFLGVMFAYATTALIIPVDSLTAVFEPQVGPFVQATGPDYKFEHLFGVLLNNLGVAGGVLVLSVLYRTSGALLVLVWNASVWGTVFAYFARVQEQAGLQAVWAFSKTMICILPHIMAEASGYIMMALGGIVVVRLLAKKPANDVAHRSLLLNVAALCGGGLITLVIAAVAEVVLAPTLLSIFTGG